MGSTVQSLQSREVRRQAQCALACCLSSRLYKGVTSNSSSYTFLDPIDNEEKEEGEEVVSQLVWNRWRGRVISMVDPEDPALLISISSLDNEHSNDLACFSP